MLIKIFFFLVLLAPVIVEVIDDRNGDKHPNNDWIFRGLIMIIASIVSSMFLPDKNVIQCFVMSLGLFLLVFPYLMNYVHYKNKVTTDPKWWSHLSKKAWPDNQQWWYGIIWWQRLIIQLIAFTPCVLIFQCWGKIFGFNNPC